MTNSAKIARHEYKYVVRPEAVDRLKAAILPYCRMDEHGAMHPGGYYPIHSLYFDDDRYRLYWDTENNVPVRLKLRVRSYGGGDGGIVKFEVKRRVHDAVLKSSVCLPGKDWPLRLLPGGGNGMRCVCAGEREALDTFLGTALVMGARPKMLVRYERLAFRSTIDDYVRITFDRIINHQPMTDCNLAGYPNRWTAMDDPGSMGSRGSNVLVELKFVHSAPVWLMDIARRYELVRQGYSKYACAVRRSVMDRAAGWDLVPALSRDRLYPEVAWTF